MTEPKKDVKVWLRPAMHALLKARCEGLPGEPTMGAYIERLVERDIGAKAMDAMLLEEAFRRAGIDRDEAERAARSGAVSGFGEIPR